MDALSTSEGGYFRTGSLPRTPSSTWPELFGFAWGEGATLLRNIYKELESDLGIKPVNHGYLEKWAKQGVLLLNSVLTVRNGQAFSHKGKGWEQLTDAAIKALSQRPEPVVFILWGKAAQGKISLINTKTNIVLQSVHPSPLSANRAFSVQSHFPKRISLWRQWAKSRLIGNCPNTWKSRHLGKHPKLAMREIE